MSSVGQVKINIGFLKWNSPFNLSLGVEKVLEDDEREFRHEEKSKSSKNDKNQRPDKKRKVE